MIAGRKMEQPTPQVRRSDVERIVRRDFSPNMFSEVLGVLDQYGAEDYHRERARVQLAVLKLAGGSQERLLRAIEEAKCDYRDVLAQAEYPDYPWDAAQLSEKERKRIIDGDWKQYSDWLSR
jgi:hypothetical protein